MNPSVAAVIVTYKRPDMAIDLIESLLDQTYSLSGIYIVDNNDDSTDTRRLLAERGWISKQAGQAVGVANSVCRVSVRNERQTTIHYLGISRNVGCSEGMDEGLSAALKQVPDWVWLMDDDILPEPGCLSALIEAAGNHPRAVGLGCSRRYQDGELVTFDAKRINTRRLAPFVTGRIRPSDLERSCFPIQTIPFEGMLVRESAVRSIGLPDRRFFILGDDTDYCLRLMREGELLYVSGARLIRRIKPILALDVTSWKSYYTIRNMAYLDLRYSSAWLAYLRVAIGALLNFRHYGRTAAGRATWLRSYRDAFVMYREPLPYNR